MERLIQFFRLANEDCSAAAWLALGLIMMLAMLAGVFALRWISGGGMHSGDGILFLARRREIARCHSSWKNCHTRRLESDNRE